jgi:inorganic pyrophosphatase
MKRSSARNGKSGRGSEPPQISVIIETPRGSRNKLKYDPAKRLYKLSKVLPEGMVFPYDFGFVPATEAEDGDPLDVLVLTDAPLFPGCLVDCALIGIIEAEQQEKDKITRNDRLIAVAEASILYSEIKDLAGLNPSVLKHIEAFFVNYQKVRNVDVTILAHHGPQKALEILHRTRRKK